MGGGTKLSRSDTHTEHPAGANTLLAIAARSGSHSAPSSSYPTRGRASISCPPQRPEDDRSKGPVQRSNVPGGVRVLRAAVPDWERPRVRNDDSVAIEAVYGDVAELLLGDVGADVGRSILSRLTPVSHRILKVAHHGSRTSTSRELLEDRRTQIAAVSAGRGNSFGHPAPEVLRRLDSICAVVCRTDFEGEVSVETDGITLRVRGFVNRAR